MSNLLQYVSNEKGKKTAVIIPIDRWEKLIKKYADLENDLALDEIPEWHKEIIDNRLQDYLQNPENVTSLEELSKEIESEL